MNKIQQNNRFSTCIEGMNITSKNGDLVTDCPFIIIKRSTKRTDMCGIHIIGSEKTNSSFSIRSFHIGILHLTFRPKPFYSAIIPEHSLTGIYRSLKNKEYKDAYSCLLPEKYEEEYLKHAISEFGDWLYQKKMITKEEMDVQPTEDESLG